MTKSKQSAVSAAPRTENATTYGGSTGLHSLPNEMIDKVCACLSFESLKSFRLVSRNYEPPTKKYLYETFVLWRTNESWHKLGSIAETPELAMLVKCIKVARMSPLLFFDKNAWAIYNIDLKATRAQEQTGYEAYLKWFEAEEDLPMSLRRANFFLLGHFGQDLAVETVEEPTLAIMNNKKLSQRTYFNWRRSLGVPLSRRTQETRIFGEEWSVTKNSHLELFLHAAMSTGAALSTLRLHDITEIMGKPYIVPFYLGNLKRLELDMSVFLAPEQGPHYFLPWMSALTNLEAFKLIQRSRGEHNIDVMGALYPHNFPRLLWMHLENVMTDWTALREFLFGHRHTLTYLKVMNPDCRLSVWSQMRAQLEDSSVFEKLQGGISDLAVPLVVAAKRTDLALDAVLKRS